MFETLPQFAHRCPCQPVYMFMGVADLLVVTYLLYDPGDGGGGWGVQDPAHDEWFDEAP